jgi:uncharacterized protein YndB with AHSA1/START domain
MTIQINPHAAARYTESVTIDAPIQVVWDILSTIENWPSWNPDVKSVSLVGPLDSGTTFVWKSGPSKITSRLEEVSPPNRIVWTGKTMGIKAVHIYALEDHNGQTVVTSSESFDGLIVKLLKNMMVATMTKSGHAGLGHLKDVAEKSSQSL